METAFNKRPGTRDYGHRKQVVSILRSSKAPRACFTISGWSRESPHAPARIRLYLPVARESPGVAAILFMAMALCAGRLHFIWNFCGEEGREARNVSGKGVFLTPPRCVSVCIFGIPTTLCRRYSPYSVLRRLSWRTSPGFRERQLRGRNWGRDCLFYACIFQL